MKKVTKFMVLLCLLTTLSYSQSSRFTRDGRDTNMRGYSPDGAPVIKEEKIDTVKLVKVEKIDTVVVSKSTATLVLNKMAKDDGDKIVYIFNENSMSDYKKGYIDGDEKRGTCGPVAAGCCLGVLGPLIINNGANEPEIYPDNISDKEQYRQGYKNSSRKKGVNIAAGMTIASLAVTVIYILAQ